MTPTILSLPSLFHNAGIVSSFFAGDDLLFILSCSLVNAQAVVSSAFSSTEASSEIAAGTAERALALLAAQPEEAEAARPQQLHLERFAAVAAALAKPRST